MTITQKDIAGACGVSYTTVNLVLNGKAEKVNISRKMIEKVQATAREMGYIKNQFAHNLVTGKAYSIGLVVSSSFTRPYQSNISEGFNQIARQNEYDLIFLPRGSDEETKENCQRAIQQGKIDAIAFIGGERSKTLQALHDMKFPTVCLEMDAKGLSSQVRFDSRPGIHQAVAHLAKLGHTHIHWLGLKMPDGKPRLPARLKAFKEAVAKHNLQRSESYLAHDSTFDYPGEMQQYYHRELSEKWHKPQGATAALCFNDTMAMALNYVLLERGMRAPRDFSIIGFDDMYGDVSVPPLTTISHCLEDMGRKAMEVLLEVLQGGLSRERKPIGETVDAKLIVRQSTAPPCGA